MIARRSPIASPLCSSGNSTLPSTVHQGSRAKSWNTKVNGFKLPTGAAPRSSAAPPLGCNNPPRTCSSVLLPQPEGPTIATTSPPPTVNVTLSSTSSAPKRWLIWSAIRSIWCSFPKSVVRCFETVIARSEATKQSIFPLCRTMDCFAALAMTDTLVRLHELFRNNRVGIESLVDKASALQPFDLVVDIFDVELALPIDIGAIADHLLDRQIGIFGDDLQ